VKQRLGTGDHFSGREFREFTELVRPDAAHPPAQARPFLLTDKRLTISNQEVFDLALDSPLMSAILFGGGHKTHGPDFR